ncbi:MAG: TPM domain-containing protein, partial [Candidatus Auribacterota bacterium]|nr:TPM domain-containing protein [Candidatus Auribacterota bacterium]
MKNLIKFILTVLIILVLAGRGSVLAGEARYPDYSGYVNDFAGLLSGDEEARLNNLIGALEKKTTA